MTTVVAPTGETRVTTTTPQNEHNPTIAALRDGGWIVSWTLTTSDEQDAEIYQQRYNADGQAVDGAIMVNKHTAGQQLYSSVTALSDGGWIVAWKSTGPDGSGTKISHQRYAADGQKIGPERQIDGGQSIKVTTLNDGGWIITYHAGGVQDFDIYQQRYGADGYEQGAGPWSIPMLEVTNSMPTSRHLLMGDGSPRGAPSMTLESKSTSNASTRPEPWFVMKLGSLDPTHKGRMSRP